MMYSSQDNEELFYWLALTFVPGIGIQTGKALIAKYGSAASVFKQPLKELKSIAGITETRAKGFKDAAILKRADTELSFVLNNNIQVITSLNGYPARLANCNDAPLMLYTKGNADLNAQKMVAVVGTRKNSDYGEQLCDELIQGLRSLENILVVSGLALGIDAIVHKRCVEAGIPTLGVLGHGLDRMYPHTHQSLARQMMANGGVLTEFPSQTLPEKGNFPMRNRIVAGLSDVTIVVESKIAGGALITARMASGYNRDVAAYPGRVNDSRSEGCNELIRTNIAAMITKADDLAEMMNWNKDKKARAVQKQLFLNFTPDEQKVIDLLQAHDSVHADELYHHTQLSSSQLAAILLQLELQGIIKTLPGKLYRMC